MDSFQDFLDSKQPILPKLHCFQDCWDEPLHRTPSNCPLYEELSLEEVILFAEQDIEQVATQLYFSDICFLNLK